MYHPRTAGQTKICKSHGDPWKYIITNGRISSLNATLLIQTYHSVTGDDRRRIPLQHSETYYGEALKLCELNKPNNLNGTSRCFKSEKPLNIPNDE